MSPLLVAGGVFALVAALVHVGIFVLESVAWLRPAVWRRFGVRSQEEAETLRAFAYNQGYYNLFLAIGAGTAIVMLASGMWFQGGAALVLFSLASMVFAALVLVTSQPKLWRAAAVQGTAPALGIVFVALGLITA